MSVKALSAVFEDSQAVGAGFTVLLAMADWADHNGRCHPSYNQIAAKARVSRRTAIDAIEILIQLGELEREVQGHAPTEQDDDDPSNVRAQWRNSYRIMLVRPKPQAVQPPHYLPSPSAVQSDHHQKPAQGVQFEPAGGAVDPVQVVQSGASHIRTRPSDLTTVSSVRPSEVPAPVEAFRLAWNAAVTHPIAQCQTLTKKRRRWIRAALVERPLDAWREIFARVNRSTFCRGENERGWVVSLDWLVSSPDSAVKVLEGRYDDRPKRERPFTAKELEDAKRIRANALGCPHGRTCGTVEECLAKIIRKWRGEAVAS